MAQLPRSFDDRFEDGELGGAWASWDTNVVNAEREEQNGVLLLKSPAQEGGWPWNEQGILLKDSNFEDFEVQVDIVGVGSRSTQGYGLFARMAIGDSGIGEGYALFLNPESRQLEILGGDFNQAIRNQPRVTSPLSGGIADDKTYRLLFRGDGSELYGALYHIEDPGTVEPVALNPEGEAGKTSRFPYRVDMAQDQDRAGGSAVPLGPDDVAYLFPWDNLRRKTGLPHVGHEKRTQVIYPRFVGGRALSLDQILE